MRDAFVFALYRLVADNTHVDRVGHTSLEKIVTSVSERHL